MTEFFDSAGHHFPDGATHAALYLDGRFAAPPGLAARFSHVRWITVLGDPAAGIADYEAGDGVFAQPGALRAWAAARRELGKRARVYCDRSNAAAVAELCKGLPHLFWISTLDDKRWTAAGLAADLAAHWRVKIDPGRIWGNQYAGGVDAQWDTSDLFGEW